jgi:hypothetical protein
MLAPSEDEMAGIMSHAVAMEQWSSQHRAFIVETFLKMVTELLKGSEYEYFASIAVLLVTEKFLAAIPCSYV